MIKTVALLIFILLLAEIAICQDTDANKKIGICLSSGGALGFAHAGVLKAFEEGGIEINMISGASMGAIIGSLYACGYSADDIMKIAKKYKIYKKRSFSNFNVFNKRGLSNHKKLTKILDKVLPVDTFEELKIPFALSITDMIELEEKIISSGANLKQYIMASASIPVIFQPVELDGTFYIDGGITNHIPVEFLVGKNDIVIVVECTVTGGLKILNRRFILKNSIAAWLKAANATRYHKADYTIIVEGLESYSFMDYQHYLKIYDLGYKAGKKFIEEHFKLVNFHP